MILSSLTCSVLGRSVLKTCRSVVLHLAAIIKLFELGCVYSMSLIFLKEQLPVLKLCNLYS